MGNRHVLPHLVERFKSENPFTIYGEVKLEVLTTLMTPLATVLVMEEGSVVRSITSELM